MKDILKPIIVLTSICLIVTAFLAYINTVTSPIITAAEQKNAENARMEVLTKAKNFQKLDIKDLPENVLEVFRGDNDSGYVIIVQSKGYGGNIKLICGIKNDGSIENIKTLSHSETKGIGSKVTDNDSGYRDNYFNKTSDDYNSVDAISGATISSKAYKKAVGLAFAAFDKAKGV